MNETLNNKILYYRKKYGYTQAELGAKLNVTAQTVSSWERAKSSPDNETILLIANLFKVTTDELLGNESQTLNKNKEELGLLSTSKKTIDSFDKVSVFSKLTNIFLICFFALIITGYTVIVLAKSAIAIALGSILILLGKICQTFSFICFLLGKSLKNNFTIKFLLLFIIITCEILSFTIEVINTINLNDSVTENLLKTLAIVYLICITMRFIIFPFAFEDKPRNEINANRFKRLFFIISIIAFITSFFSTEIGSLIFTMAYVCLIICKKDRQNRYYYTLDENGCYITFRDYKREKAEKLAEKENQQTTKFNLKNHICKAFIFISSGIKAQGVALLTFLIIVFLIAIFSPKAIKLDYSISLPLISFWILSSIPFLTKKSNLTTFIVSIITIIIALTISVISLRPALTNQISKILPIYLPITEYCFGYFAFILFAWFYKNDEHNLSTKIFFTLIMTLITIWFSINATYFIVKNSHSQVFSFFFWLIFATSITLISIKKTPRYEDKTVITNTN